ncbi:MAG: hypothetical protein NPIRA02_01210 [Nitrospirales bacterium]|nr:MAG: hypothetical protein NPIRA02_01210 [Nitrospirales bacterium]
MVVHYRVVLHVRPGQEARLSTLLRECGAVRVESPISGYLVGYGPAELGRVLRDRRPDVKVFEDVSIECETVNHQRAPLVPGQLVLVAMPQGWTMTGLLENVRDGRAEVLMVMFEQPQRVSVPVEAVQTKELPEPWCDS